MLNDFSLHFSGQRARLYDELRRNVDGLREIGAEYRKRGERGREYARTFFGDDPKRRDRVLASADFTHASGTFLGEYADTLAAVFFGEGTPVGFNPPPTTDELPKPADAAPAKPCAPVTYVVRINGERIMGGFATPADAHAWGKANLLDGVPWVAGPA